MAIMVIKGHGTCIISKKLLGYDPAGKILLVQLADGSQCEIPCPQSLVDTMTKIPLDRIQKSFIDIPRGKITFKELTDEELIEIIKQSIR